MIAKWLRRLQLSPRTMRSIDETLLDWRHEAASARTFASACQAHARNSAALFRAALGAAIEESRQFVPTYWSVAIPAVLLLIVGVPWLSTIDFTFFAGYPNVQSLAWFTLSRTTATALPMAVFIALIAASAKKPAPALAIFAGAVTAALLLTAVLMPAAWRHYAEVGLRRPGFFPSVPMIYEAPSLIARIAIAVLLGNRVRIDPKRPMLLLGALAIVTLLLGHSVFSVMVREYSREMGRAYAEPIAWLLFAPSMALETVRLTVDWIPIPFVPIALWYGLVKRQEQLISSPATDNQ